MAETPSVNAAGNAASGVLSAEARLAGYSGPALLVRADGSGIAANRKGAAMQALLSQSVAPDLAALIAQAASSGSLAAGTVSFTGDKGEILLEVTVTPNFDGDDILLVLARDLTMERNLRSALVESRQRYKDLVEVSSDFAWEVGPDQTFAFVSPKGALGYTADELVGRPPEKIVNDPEDYTPLPFLSDWPMEDVEMWLNRADGSTACVTISCLPLVTEDGEWRGTRGVCRDVTDERRRQQALNQARHREQLLNHIVSTIRDEVEPQNMLNAAASATARALGAAGCRIYRMEGPEKFVVAAEYGDGDIPKPLEELLKTLCEQKEDKAVDTVERSTGAWHVLTRATHYRQSVNGAICMWRDAAGDPWDDDSRILIGDVANQLGIANEQIANHERIVKLSRTDAMTGLLNRRAFLEDELPRHLGRLKRNGQVAGLFYLDLDNFKQVNDVHGHQAGDDAIIALRDLMIEYSRPGDIMARLGGDEFAMWLDGIPEKVAIGRAGDLIRAAESLRRFSGDDAHPLGVSIGVAMYDPETDESLEDLLARADAAMYVVKRAGKGGFEMAPPAGAPSDLPGDETDDDSAGKGTPG